MPNIREPSPREVAEDVDRAADFALGLGQRLAFLARHVGRDRVELPFEDVGDLEQQVAAAGPGILAQPWNAACAASAAASTSAAEPFTNRPTTSSVFAGLRFSNVGPETHSPSM